MTNNSIKHQSFVYTQLNDQTALFLKIRFSVIHLFAHSLNSQTILIDPQIRLYQVLAHGSPGNEGIIHIPKALALFQSPHLIIKYYIQDTRLVVGFPPLQRCSRCIL